MPRLGLIVNPIAGMGGRVGLKGTDGPEILVRALALGAAPVAEARATLGLRLLAGSPVPADTLVLAAEGPMGETAARAAGLTVESIDGGDGSRGARQGGTSADDTRDAARTLRDRQVDLILFVGGDGTARDICAAIGTDVPVVGLPSGVKMHSAVFAVGPRAGADIAAGYLTAPDRARCHEREVVDLDEDAYRRGVLSVRMFGVLLVPQAPRLLQGLKAASASPGSVDLDGLAGAVLDLNEPGDLLVLGPGTTIRTVGDALGIEKTLLGVDLVEVGEDGRGRIITRDASERDLLDGIALVRRHRPDAAVRIVLSPTGGQGFLVGRGNQQISPTVVRAVGWPNVLVLATPAKVAALAGSPLLVDTGDPVLDAEVPRHIRVMTGPRTMTICRVAPA